MDKSDIALIISVISAVFAFLSVKYTRKLALNDAMRMKRKPLVLEIASSPSKDYVGWHSALATVRNFEPVAARITNLRLRNEKRKSLKLLGQHAAFGNGPAYNPGTVDILPEDEADTIIKLGISIDPEGHVSSATGSASVKYIHFYSNAQVTASDLVLDWEWSDGTKR